MNTTAYLLTSVVIIVDPVFDQVEVHLGGYDATIVRRQLYRYPVKEHFDVLLLLLNEVFERVEKFVLFFSNKHVHRLGDCLNLLSSTILDVPEANTITVILINLMLLACSRIIYSGTSATPRPGRAMLRHLSDTSVTTSSWVDFNALDVQPE